MKTDKLEIELPNGLPPLTKAQKAKFNQKRSYKKYIEKRPTYFRDYYEKNKTSIKIKQKIYKTQIRNKIKEYDKEYRHKNLETINTRRKEYRIKNRDKINTYRKNYRNRIKENTKVIRQVTLKRTAQDRKKHLESKVAKSPVKKENYQILLSRMLDSVEQSGFLDEEIFYE